MRAILHVDMDAFFASVEQRDDPKLRGRPVIVGGASRRGVVCAASYEARPFGVHSAMPMSRALRLCPRAIVVPPRHERYSEVSARVFAVFKRYTPLVEGLSVDEAFLDVTASRELFGDGETIARRIQGDVLVDTGLNASAGVAPIKFAAKIASDLKKPRGLVIVPEDVRAFLAPLPIERMWGLGPKAAPRVRAAGFETLGDLANAPLERLEHVLGKAGAHHVQTLARGEDARDVIPGRAAISIGAEETFERDLTRAEDLHVQLLALASKVAQRMVHAEVATRGITLKVKYNDFSIRTRAMRFPAPVADTDSLYRAAKELLTRVNPAPIRLLGISANALEVGPPGIERTLFEEDAAPERRHRLESVVANVRERFGQAGVTRAALIPSRGERR